VNPLMSSTSRPSRVEETARLKTLNGTEPSGVLEVGDDLVPDSCRRLRADLLHGVATTGQSEGLDTIEVPADTLAMFRIEGPHLSALQEVWAAATSSSPRSRGGWDSDLRATLAFDPDAGAATGEFWLLAEPD
jgi:AraC family transcriptional regulator